MAKKIKTPNQFGATDGTATATETKAPGDETPKVKLKNNGEPFKVRGPSGPRVIDPRMADLLKTQDAELATFTAGQVTRRTTLRNKLDLESKTAKAAIKMEATLQKLTPEEQSWLLKANAEKLASLDKIKAQMTAP